LSNHAEPVFEDVQASPRSNPLTDTTRPPRSRRTVRSGGRPSGAPKPRPSARPAPAPPTDYTKPVLGLIQLGAAPLFLLGQRNRALLADGVTVTTYAEPMARGLNELAQQNQQVAQALDVLVKMGPYGAVIEPFLLCGLQIATNHKPDLHKMTKLFGSKTVDEIVGPEQEPDNASSNDGDRRVPS